ncbi:MAG: hypothetical protein QF921_01215 [Pseudomonadales bacterium]|mgnify:CR=1 FL=1|jgi:hypothetical protein|nr:hypothetical protein [Pseudomonadales bacterium]MDP6472147.1 hypothetical protein [Pseudomonadales bacterium]MDP6826601.1 hypothetical protein [Pseudomonadales bacterium]MDP6970128.1 hypothetical protein [Pseudomonadales bacterium]|tara:strand:+ start:321 stop:1391 length:1071 start_codon:yes stop_codon:yes gene_type:complete
MDENGSWFGFDDLFWLTLLVLFVSTSIGALLRRFRRDRCLRLFDDYHITFVHADGKLLWGDLFVTSQGLQILYDAPFVTSRGMVKASHLVQKNELDEALGLCRTVHALTDEERLERSRQIERTFNPGVLARSRRRVRNYADMLSDAIGKSLGLVMGSLGGRLGAAMISRKRDVSELSETVTGTVANAYEPLLERYIGKPVVIECRTAPDAAEPTSEFTGYLVEYTQDFLAVFNSTQTPVEQLDLQLATAEHAGFDTYLDAESVTFTCIGPDALIVRDVTTHRGIVNLDTTLLPGCSLRVRTDGDPAPKARIELTHQFDLICPRANARVRFGSEVHCAAREWSGLAPQDTEAANAQL